MTATPELKSNTIATRLALGTVQWGTAYGIANRTGRPADAEVRRMLEIARAAGVTTLDTARAYGESETVIGRTVGPDWQIVTKLAPTATTAYESLATSRAALCRDYLDVVLLHRPEQFRTAAWNDLRRERDAGRIGKIGVSAIEPHDAWAALANADIDCIQVATSLFDQRLSRSGFFAAALGREVFVRSVFLQGIAHLSPMELPTHLSQLRQPLQAVHHWASDNGVSPSVGFLTFVAALPEATILLGCETYSQLSDNLRIWQDANRLIEGIVDLAAAMPEFSDDVLNPAQWPRG